MVLFIMMDFNIKKWRYNIIIFYIYKYSAISPNNKLELIRAFTFPIATYGWIINAALGKIDNTF